MSFFLKQSTTVTIDFGPILSAGDGVTECVNLGFDLSAVRVIKNGATSKQKDSATSATHSGNAYFAVELSATDTDTLGALRVYYRNPTICLPVWEDFVIITSAVWNSLFGNSVLPVDMTKLNGSAFDLQKFHQGAAHVLSASVTSASFTPTSTQFEVSGFYPALGNSSNLNGRSIYWRTGNLNEYRTNIVSMSDQGSGVYRITVSSPTPTLPVHTDTINVV